VSAGEINLLGGRMNKKILLLLVIVLMSSSVLALGITPGRSTFDYVSGGEQTVEFSVINSDKQDMNLVVIVDGELKDSVSVSEDSFSIGASEGGRSLTYSLKMPAGLKPGLHAAEISVVSLPDKSPTGEAFIGAVVGVKTQLHVLVPFPGKFAEAKLNIMEPVDGKIKFVIPVMNRGVENLEKVSATISVYRSLNNKIVSLETREVSILSKQRKELVVDWDVIDVESGKYSVVAVVNYDGRILNFERRLDVGLSALNLIGIGVKDFTLGDIAKFEMVVESDWSETIDNAYAQMFIYDESGLEVADLKSSTKDVPPKTKTLMELFWDTAGIQKGIYDTSLFLRHGESAEQSDFKMDVKDDEIKIIGLGYVISEGSAKGSKGGLVTILVVVIIFLVLANFSWFFYFRKKMKK